MLIGDGEGGILCFWTGRYDEFCTSRFVVSPPTKFWYSLSEYGLSDAGTFGDEGDLSRNQVGTRDNLFTDETYLTLSIDVGDDIITQKWFVNGELWQTRFIVKRLL